jgi:phage-related protein
MPRHQSVDSSRSVPVAQDFQGIVCHHEGVGIDVKSAIESWPDGILADFARIMELLMEFGPDLRMPHSRAMGGGLFELRPRGREGIGRVFYCFVIGQRVVILHAFEKKTMDTPDQELRIARRRMKKVQNA